MFKWIIPFILHLNFSLLNLLYLMFFFKLFVPLIKNNTFLLLIYEYSYFIDSYKLKKIDSGQSSARL